MIQVVRFPISRPPNVKKSRKLTLFSQGQQYPSQHGPPPSLQPVSSAPASPSSDPSTPSFSIVPPTSNSHQCPTPSTPDPASQPVLKTDTRALAGLPRALSPAATLPGAKTIYCLSSQHPAPRTELRAIIGGRSGRCRDFCRCIREVDQGSPLARIATTLEP